ncbi:UNVERIFIED_CONTAM: hypothetical protein GTU68_001220 [Idotea baltica]|nr:hypothetical protein [Idotea baltica]
MDFQKLIESFDTTKFIHDSAIPWAKNIVFALLIFIIGKIVAKWIIWVARKAMGKGQVDPMLIQFVVNILSWTLLLFIFVAALNQLGVNTTSFVALLGAAGVAVGFALKDSLSNFAAGVMLILFRPFRTGDFIQAAGTEGVVEEVRIFSSTLRTPDNRELTVPNGDIFGGVITNNNARETRRIDMTVGIGYGDDIPKAKATLEQILKEHELVLEDPAPFIAVGELGASSVDLLVRPWVKTDDYFNVKCDLTEKIKVAFDDAGLEFPFPQMDVHLSQENVTAA